MSFPTVIFGSIVVTGSGYTYTDRNSISTGGFALYMVPTQNVGGAGIDIGFIYVNQFGVTKTTTVSTAIGATTTAGTHVKVVLEPGDTGVRDLIGINYFAGGSPGDKINLESWNEGLGRAPYSITRSTPTQAWVPTEPTKEIGLLRSYTRNKLVPNFYPAPNPRIMPPISLIRLCPRTIPGYPVPPPGCIGGDYLPEPLSGNNHTPKTYSYVRLCPRITPGYPTPPGCIGGDFSGEPLSGKQLAAKRFPILKTWLESVVGQVVSGYVTNVQNEIILKAVSITITSTGRSEFNQVGDVNPDTGFYQMFVKSVIYDKRYLIIQLSITKTVALPGAGSSPLIDGTKKLPTPYNLQFTCPVINCDFNITRKV